MVEGNDTLRDSQDFKVEFCLENQVELALTADKVGANTMYNIIL